MAGIVAVGVNLKKMKKIKIKKKITDRLVAKYNEGEWYLEHWWGIDDFGMKRNSMQIYKIDDTGMKTVYPFRAPIRFNKFDRKTAFDGENISPYETFEYVDMLREQIAKVSTPHLNRD